MSDLIPFATRQLGSETVNTVNARDLYAYLGITQRYADWIKVQIRRAHLIDHTDYLVFHLDGNNPQGGRPQVDHHLTFDAAKHVAMMSSADKGHEVRAWFIAKEKELAAVTAQPAVLNPEHQLMIDMIVQLDRTEQRAKAAEATAARAEGKADMALADARTMTLEEFVLANGLLRQMPEAHWPSYVTWLKDVCLALGHDFSKGQVLGKRWQMENVYPLQALCALKHHVQTKPTQLALVRPHEHNGHG